MNVLVVFIKFMSVVGATADEFARDLKSNGLEDTLSENWYEELQQAVLSDDDKKANDLLLSCKSRLAEIGKRTSQSSKIPQYDRSTTDNMYKLLNAIVDLRNFFIDLAGPDSDPSVLDDISTLQCMQLFENGVDLFDKTYRIDINESQVDAVLRKFTTNIYAIVGGSEDQLGIKSQVKESRTIVRRRTITPQLPFYASFFFNLKLKIIWMSVIWDAFCWAYALVSFVQVPEVGILGTYIPFSLKTYLAGALKRYRPYGAPEPTPTDVDFWFEHVQQVYAGQITRPGALNLIGNWITTTTNFTVGNWVGFDPIKLTLFLTVNYFALRLVEKMIRFANDTATVYEQTIIIRPDDDDDDDDDEAIIARYTQQK